MSKFKVGDRVEVICNEDGICSSSNCFIKEGMLGTVLAIEDSEPKVGVEFDDNILGHRLNGEGESEHCWYMCEENLKKVEKEKIQMSSKFKVGDRVEVIGAKGNEDVIENSYIKEGMLGTIVVIEGGEPKIGVQFDDYIYGNNVGGKGKKGFCWFMFEKHIKKFEKKEELEQVCLTLEKAMNRLYEIADSYTMKQAANGIINILQRKSVDRLELNRFKKALEDK